MFVNLVLLGINTNKSSEGAAAEKAVFSSAETTASAVIFTQRESLAYSTNYALWLAGSVTKRDVQISRAILAQRLNVIDIENETMGSRLEPALLNALKASDDLIDQSGDGYITPKRAEEIKTQAEAIIAQILSESRALVVAYQQQLDQLLLNIVSDRKLDAERNLFLLIFLIILTTIFLIWITRSTLHQFDIAKEILKLEIAELEAARADLRIAQTTVKSLEDLNDSKNDFISTVNHELRTPLTSIIGYVDLLKDLAESDKSGEAKKIVAVVDKNALVLLDLVESILSLSKLDSREPELVHSEVDILKVIEKSIFVLSPQAEDAAIKIKIESDRDVEYMATGNSSQLSQVFINLISNSIKFSPKGSLVTIKLRRVLNLNMLTDIQVAITDQGIGIPESEIPMLFHRFFRASNAANSQIGGTGLGLAIVAKIVEIHHGHIYVVSSQNIGSTFTVKIPAFVSAVERLILDKRGSVLFRAIESIENSSNENLQNTCHEMGGAIGFYALEEHGQQIAIFAKWLKNNPNASDVAILTKKDELLALLTTTLRIIEVQEEKNARLNSHS